MPNGEGQLPSLEEVAKQVNSDRVARENAEAGVTADGKPMTETVPQEAEATEKVETAPEVKETVEEPVKKDPLAPKFAALSQKEKALRLKEQEINRRAKEAEDKLKEIQDRLAQVEARENDRPKRPLDALKKFGWGYTDATEDALGGYKPPEPDPLDERFKPVQEKLTEVDQLKQELQKLNEKLAEKENRENFNTVMGNIQHVIKEGGDKYELISTMGQEGLDLVRETMVQYYREFGNYLEYTEAADRVEQYYEDNLLKRLENSKKLRSRVAPAATEAKPTKPASTPQESKTKVTLTSDMTGGSNAKIDIDSLPRDAALRELAKLIKHSD